MTSLNTVQLFCGKGSQAEQFKGLEKAGYEVETAPAFSNKHVFHFTGRCNRSIGMIVTPDANPYDIFALLAETEIGNPFLVWEPERVKEIFADLSKIKKIIYAGGTLNATQDADYKRLMTELQSQRKPIVFYGPKESWKPFTDVLDHLATSGTARPGFKNGITFCDTNEQVQDVLKARVPASIKDRSLADYRFHTYEPGSAPIQEFVSKTNPKDRPRATVSFFGSATTLKKPHLAAAARSAEMCARNGWGMVNGGGTTGVMGAQMDAAKQYSVYLHGISAHERGAVGLSGSEKDPKKIGENMPRYTDCKDMVHRIEYYLEQSEAIGMLDGGIGSAQELFMVLELYRQHHKVTEYQDKAGVWHPKPMVVVDNSGTWAPMIEWARKTYPADYLAPMTVVKSMEEAETIYADQFSKHPPKLATEVMDKIIGKTLMDVTQKLTAARTGGITSIKDLEETLEGLTWDARKQQGRSTRVADWQSVYSTIDLTYLKNDATKEVISDLCGKAVAQGARSVCVPLNLVAHAKQQLERADKKSPHHVMAITVVNFPDGSDTTEKTIKDMQDAVKKGADEIDTVVPKTLLKAGDYAGVLAHLKRSIQSVHVPVKVILESAELTPEQIAAGSLLAKIAGASAVKTSTGFSKAGGADVEAVEIMRRTVGDEISVKASGGVKDFRQAMAMIEAGADIIGASGLSVTSAQQRVPAIRMNAEFQEHLPGYAMRGNGGAGMGY